MFLTKLSMKLGMVLAGGIGEGSAEDSSKDFLESLYELVFTGWVRTLVLTGLGLFLVIKGVMLGVGIVSAADDQSARKEKINSLKYMIIGVLLVVVLYIGAGFIIDIVANAAGE